MKNILVTGARAPAALDMMRHLSDAGMVVYAADSLSHPLSRGSNKVAQYFAITSPVRDIEAFVDDLETIIQEYHIDMLIPTCEEVFFISKYKQRLEQYCTIFCDRFEKLREFHDKYAFLQAAKDCYINLPATEYLDKQSDVKKVVHASQKVFKPVFSRFASQTIIHPDQRKLEGVIPSKNFPWVAQEYIAGVEYCTYGIAVKGKLQVHVCYQPTYRAGLGSGIYFTPVINAKIERFVRHFVSKHSYTGQIGFDFIVTKENKLYVLECNPRATSGIHCLENTIEWQKILLGSMQEVVKASTKNQMVALAMMTFGLKYLKSKGVISLITDFMKAKDAVWDWKDKKPAFYQFLSLVDIIIRSVKYHISLKEAATADIEWNGEEL